MRCRKSKKQFYFIPFIPLSFLSFLLLFFFFLWKRSLYLFIVIIGHRARPPPIFSLPFLISVSAWTRPPPPKNASNIDRHNQPNLICLLLSNVFYLNIYMYILYLYMCVRNLLIMCPHCTTMHTFNCDKHSSGFFFYVFFIFQIKRFLFNSHKT